MEKGTEIFLYITLNKTPQYLLNTSMMYLKIMHRLFGMIQMWNTMGILRTEYRMDMGHCKNQMDLNTMDSGRMVKWMGKAYTVFQMEACTRVNTEKINVMDMEN